MINSDARALQNLFKHGSGQLLSKCRGSVFKPALSSRHKFASILSPLPSQILYSQVSRGSAIHVFRVYIFLNFVIPGRSKALICTKKQNPKGFGRKMTSSCKWPFFFLLACFIFAKPQFVLQQGRTEDFVIEGPQRQGQYIGIVYSGNMGAIALVGTANSALFSVSIRKSASAVIARVLNKNAVQKQQRTPKAQTQPKR